MIHASRPYLFLALACLTIARSVSAQRLSREIVPTRSTIQFRGGSANPNLLTPIFPTTSPDHRWEGFAIGAVVLGAAGAIAGSQLCHLSDSANQHCVRTSVGLGLLGAFAGGITGGLIGGSIPKAPSDSSR